jgi:hypothetical protein
MSAKFPKKIRFLKWDVLRWVWLSSSLTLLVVLWDDVAKDPVFAVLGVIITPPAFAFLFYWIGLLIFFAGRIAWLALSLVYNFCRDLIKIVHEYRSR